MAERLHFHFSLSCIGEGNGTPLQCSCLENPRDGGAWWAAVYGVAQSRTRLSDLAAAAAAAAAYKKYSLGLEVLFHAFSSQIEGAESSLFISSTHISIAIDSNQLSYPHEDFIKCLYHTQVRMNDL